MVDQALAHQAAHRAKQEEPITHETWAELLHKPAKRTKEIMKTKAKELLDALNPAKVRKTIQALKKSNSELETNLHVLHKKLEFATLQIENNKEFLKKGTKLKQFYDEALKTTDQLLKEMIPLRKTLRGY